MAHSSKKSLQDEAKTITWFEREILAHKSPHGILDEASIGVWSIVEQSGLLAGEWKNHRNLMQDLDTEKVSLALGTLLGAAVHTAHAVGISLESIMALQVERERVSALTSTRQRKESSAISSTAAATRRAIRTIGVRETIPAEEQPTEMKRRAVRPRKTPTAIEPVAKRDVQPPTAPIAALPLPKKRGRPAKQQEPIALPLQNAPIITKPQRKLSAPVLFSPSSLADEHANNEQQVTPETAKRKTQVRKTRNA